MVRAVAAAGWNIIMSQSPTFDHERVLNLWAVRKRLRVIAAVVEADPSAVYAVIKRARRNRDPRARRRYLPFLDSDDRQG